METTALRQLLKSFCTNLPWNYAVLWRLRHDGQIISSWRDGYCENAKTRGPMDIMSEVIYQNDAYYREKIVGDGGSEGCSIGQVVTNMSHLQYTLGEGVVGEVANTGNHFWVSYNTVSTGEVNSKLVMECPNEWLLQLASGIKTILLVPVLPHGVMQLGSLEVVGEDLTVVAYIKDRFTLHNTGGNTVLSILNRDIQTQSSSTLTPGLMGRLDELSASTISPMKSEDIVDSVKLSKIVLSTSDHVVSLVALQDAFDVSGKDLSGTFGCESENKPGISPVGLIEISNSQNQSVCAGKLETVESKLFDLSCLEEELQAYSQCNKYNVAVLGEFNGRTMTSYPAGDSMEQLFQEEIFNDTDHRSSASLLNFPKDCELHKALGPPFWKRPSEYLWNSFSLNNKCNSSNLIFNRNLTDEIASASSADVGDVEYLLEAVVANVCRGADISNICNNVNASVTSLEKFVPHPKSQSEASALAGDNSILWSNVKSAYRCPRGSEFRPISAALKSMMTTFIDNEQVEKGYNTMQPRKGLKQSNVSKRRTKLAGNQRPRPRDRQLIQDRIKELRELVPNGVKCSIDGLLERTIEHMLYLRSVTDQAEKLKQWVHHEVSACKDIKSSESKDGSQNGTTWAFEFGSEVMVCPIVVKDLAYPGHMLIEMLCNEQGLFLDIAQVIRSLQLTILKGVIESRSNNTWAHFIVEASKSFHRTEIFWPLMHLLQRKRNTISSKI